MSSHGCLKFYTGNKYEEGKDIYPHTVLAICDVSLQEKYIGSMVGDSLRNYGATG